MARLGSKAADGISCPVTGDRGGPPPSILNQPSMALRSYVCPSDAMTGSRIRTWPSTISEHSALCTFWTKLGDGLLTRATQ